MSDIYQDLQDSLKNRLEKNLPSHIDKLMRFNEVLLRLGVDTTKSFLYADGDIDIVFTYVGKEQQPITIYLLEKNEAWSLRELIRLEVWLKTLLVDLGIMAYNEADFYGFLLLLCEKHSPAYNVLIERVKDYDSYTPLLVVAGALVKLGTEDFNPYGDALLVNRPDDDHLVIEATTKEVSVSRVGYTLKTIDTSTGQSSIVEGLKSFFPDKKED